MTPAKTANEFFNKLPAAIVKRYYSGFGYGYGYGIGYGFGRSTPWGYGYSYGRPYLAANSFRPMMNSFYFFRF